MNRIPPAIPKVTPPPAIITPVVAIPATPKSTAAPEAPAFSLRHRHRPWVAHQKLIAISFLGDLYVVVLSLVISYLIRFETPLRDLGVEHGSQLDLTAYFGHIAFGSTLMMVLLTNGRAHDPRNFLAIRRTAWTIIKACSIWFAAFLGLVLVFKINPAISRMYCGLAAGISLLLLLGWRWALYCVMRDGPLAGALRQRTVFVGWNDECDRTVKRLSEGRAQRIMVSGVIAPPNGALETQPPESIPVLGGYSDLRPILRESGADVVMAVDGVLSRDEMAALAECCGKEFVDFKLVPSCFQILVSGLQLESFHGMPVLGLGKLPLHHVFNNALKRAIDIVGAVVGLILSAPVMMVFGLMVWMESRGPVIYRQRRIGLNGKPFDILKIRSMKLDAEVSGKPGWTVKDDPRRLRVGKFMRAWNVDELPQFWNVLRGDMSLVGPRPERPELIEGFKEDIPHYNVRHHIKPGVTGWAQVNGLRGDTCLRERVKFDLDYIEHWNFLLDIQILFKTFINRKGAC